ncbi:bifunctional 4-hydroxy-2-oxoglutarate aldolase/2-dehydro-3-deoxy-phosphogluconate aldolase, partial [Campylobacter sp. MIT 21-1685]|uniref:bifunctional 4-hydroxy-2-oxoglutarate aldolase/2-dehydro-3-deoxy-phosphogluconate aldolase n=1 Tax=unclassified Campylobacter TaxID=2593542 RepID=UPI00224AD0CC
MKAKQILQKSKIIPVIVVEELESTLELAKILVDSGIEILEITLRTQNAFEAIKCISKEIPNAIIGAGTVLNAKQLELALKAGAQFAISPGFNATLAQEALKTKTVFIPGIATPSELMQALEFGFEELKFFPAQLCGGIAMLNTFASVFNQVQFCPTGGINYENMDKYLSLKNVL